MRRDANACVGIIHVDLGITYLPPILAVHSSRLKPLRHRAGEWSRGLSVEFRAIFVVLALAFSGQGRVNSVLDTVSGESVWPRVSWTWRSGGVG